MNIVHSSQPGIIYALGFHFVAKRRAYSYIFRSCINCSDLILSICKRSNNNYWGDFDQASLEMLIKVENQIAMEISGEIAEFYSKDIDLRKLERQMYMLPALYL